MSLARGASASRRHHHRASRRKDAGGRGARSVLARAEKKNKGLFEFWRSSDDNTSRFSQKAKDDMYQEQLEILASRKNRDRAKAKADEVRERRVKVSRLMKGIDKPKKSGPQVYDEPKNSIPIPLNPIGMPKYDGGERFDLKAPYCDEGYVDEDADVMKKIFGFFSGKGKEEEGNEE